MLLLLATKIAVEEEEEFLAVEEEEGAARCSQSLSLSLQLENGGWVVLREEWNEMEKQGK